MGDFAQNLSALPVHGAMPYQIARGKINRCCCPKSECSARLWGDALPNRHALRIRRGSPAMRHLTFGYAVHWRWDI
uniref:Uncharacterized protein n=1 Tax=Triticum urartu TaxID=4572 RepID=A0A8R7PT97_TRIUA